MYVLGTLNIAGGTVENTASYNSWGINCMDNGKLNITDGSIIADRGVDLNQRTELNMSGGEITANGYQGVRMVQSAKVNVTGGTISGVSVGITESYSSSSEKCIINILGGNILATNGTAVERWFWRIFYRNSCRRCKQRA